MGLMLPVIIQFKMLFQDLCESKLDWDQTLSGNLLKKWNSLITELQEAQQFLNELLPHTTTAVSLQPLPHQIQKLSGWYLQRFILGPRAPMPVGLTPGHLSRGTRRHATKAVNPSGLT